MSICVWWCVERGIGERAQSCITKNIVTAWWAIYEGECRTIDSNFVVLGHWYISWNVYKDWWTKSERTGAIGWCLHATYKGMSTLMRWTSDRCFTVASAARLRHRRSLVYWLGSKYAGCESRGTGAGQLQSKMARRYCTDSRHAIRTHNLQSPVSAMLHWPASACVWMPICHETDPSLSTQLDTEDTTTIPTCNKDAGGKKQLQWWTRGHFSLCEEVVILIPGNFFRFWDINKISWKPHNLTTNCITFDLITHFKYSLLLSKSNRM